MLQSGKDNRADITHEQHRVRQEVEGTFQVVLPLCGWDAPLGSKEKLHRPTILSQTHPFPYPSCLHYLSVHEVVLQLEMPFSLLVNAARFLLTKKERPRWSGGLHCCGYSDWGNFNSVPLIIF